MSNFNNNNNGVSTMETTTQSITNNGVSTMENTPRKKPIVEILQDTSLLVENPANRPLSYTRVARLAKEIHKHKTVPALICTEDYVILDGHHRRAALELINEQHGYQPYYSLTIVPDSISEDIVLYNKEQVSWKVPQYVNFYGNIKGIRDYELIIEHAHKSGFTEPVIATMASSGAPAISSFIKGKTATTTVGVHGNVNKFVKEGTFQFQEQLFFKRLAHTLKVGSYMRKGVSTNFAKAIIFVSHKPKYDSHRMEHKAEICGASYLNGIIGTNNYILALEDIYNYRTNEKDKVYFTTKNKR